MKQKKKDTNPDKGLNQPPQQEHKPGSVDPEDIRQKIKQAVGSRAVTLVENILAKDASLSYLAIKYLFEIAGLFPASAAEDAEQEDSLTKILLRHLGLEDEIKTGNEVTKDTQGNAPTEQKDAVK